MQDFTIHAYLIECLSNLHVGSGDNNYGVIDKQVQRDTITHEPIIHASGLKGALREYFEESVRLDPKKIRVLFGSDKNVRDELKQGKLRFFEARLICIPVRGTANEAFYRATSPEMIKAFNDTASKLGLENLNINMNGQENINAKTEFGNFTLYSKVTHIGEIVAKMEHATLTDEVFKHLPIIARNRLDNGQSENLWYEEVIPRESCFYFFVAAPDNLNEEGVDFEKDFNIHVHEHTIQIGANATVGYGYCKISKIS